MLMLVLTLTVIVPYRYYDVYDIYSVIGWACRYAMKCLDKKRIKMKGGETLALNERIMLSLVSHGVNNSCSLRIATYLF